MSDIPVEIQGHVARAASALCQLKCAWHDRDPNCQEMGRCGDNWRAWIGAARSAAERR